MKIHKTFISEVLLLICAIIWGLSYIAQKSAMAYMGPLAFLFFRYSLGSVTLIPFFIFNNRSKNKRNETSLLTYKNLEFWKKALFCGFINLTATAFVQIGLNYTDASKAGFLTSIYILIVPLISIIIYHKKHNYKIYIGIAMCTIGLYFLSFNYSVGFAIGDLIVLCSSLFYAIHIILWERFANNVEPLSFIIVEFAFASIVALCFSLIFENLYLSNILECLPAILFAGIFASGISYTFQLFAQRHVTASIAALLMSTESLFAAFGGALLLHEVMNKREVLGASLIFLAIIFIQSNNILMRKSRQKTNLLKK